MSKVIKKQGILVVLLFASLLSACETTQSQLLDSNKSQLALRSIQTRSFDTSDKQQTMRSVISTLQDLEFVIDKADMVLGTITATKLNYYRMRITVTVRPRGEKSMLVRANLEYNQNAVTDPKQYQNFFVALEKSMFLAAQNVD